ncbi:hypothetical protein K8S17_00865 [bacterium]|nr:hypothetical protein [bacterium]
MRATAVVCVLVMMVLSVAAMAEVSTSNVRPADAVRPESVIRVGNLSASPYDRTNQDPQLTNKAYPGAPMGVWRDPPCELECNACWLAEGEGPCYDEYVDNYNGGCNSSPEVFWTVYPGYGPVTICGQGGTYLVGGSTYRDTDWYELTFTESRELTVTCTAEFDVQLLLIEGTGGCPAPTAVASDTQLACVEAGLTYMVTAGTWWVWVGPANFSEWPCDSDYILTIHGYDYVCVLDCPEGVPIEGEPLCETDYEDHHNGGCNSDPPVFQPIEPSPSTIVRCGEAGNYDYYGSCYRDTDWYEIVLDEPRHITACVAAEFPVSLILAVPDPDCSNVVIVESAAGDVCTEVCVNAAVDPGVYYVFIAPQFGSTIPCGARYIFSIDGYTTPVEQRNWGIIKSLYR